LNFSIPSLQSISIISEMLLSVSFKQYFLKKSSFVNLIISFLSSMFNTKVVFGISTDATINLFLILSISGINVSKTFLLGLN